MRHMLSAGRWAAPIRRWAARRTQHRPRGQSLVELALLLPVMMLLFAGALDLGRVFYSQITIENAAKEGALEAARNPRSFDNTKPCDPTTNRVLCLVLNEAKGSLYEIAASDVSMACSPSPCPADPAFGDTVTVTVAGHFTLLTPVLAQILGPTVTLAASSTAQLGIEPDPGAAPTAAPTASPTSAPTPDPSASPDPSPTTPPEPTPTPVCLEPDVSGSIRINPGSGRSANPGPATQFDFTAPSVTPQPGCTFTYTWSFGDGASASTETATHAYANTGNGPHKTYTVTLAISTSGVPQSWTGSDSVQVNP